MNNLESISVVLPSKFETNLQLRFTLDCLSQQLGPNDEICIVDGHDGDRSSVIQDEIHRNIHWITDPQKGIAEARNIGLKHTLHNIVVFMDADCTPGPNFLDGFRQSVRPDVLVQSYTWNQEVRSPLDWHHMLWRRTVSSAVSEKNIGFTVDGRGFGIEKATLFRHLGEHPFHTAPNIHGGEGREAGTMLVQKGVQIAFHPDVTVTHRGDPLTLRRLLQQKYTHGYGDAQTDVLLHDTFGVGNFERAVLNPVREGVSPNLALYFWTAYVLGAYAGLQDMGHQSSIHTSHIRQY